MMKSPLMRLVARIEESFGVVCLVAIAVVINLQIVRRYFFNDPYIWPEEIIRITMIWLSFIGAGIGFRRGAQITVDTAVLMLPARLRAFAFDVADLVIAGVFLLVGIKANQLAGIVMNAPMAATNLPTAIIVWPLVVLSVQAVAYSALRIFVRHREGLEAVQHEPVLE
jgi:TRAP-type C4-dicarboxylate transport system permease small subunit